MTPEQIAHLIKSATNLVFLTGAGVSVPSGIPDYRSIDGLYQKAPEYLLSRRALLTDTKDFHDFVKHIYHPEATPNLIHTKMAELGGTVITQNIDGLHKKAGSRDVIEFHGDLYTCYCEKCRQHVPYQDFLQSYEHAECGGTVRPNVVLYDEGIDYGNIFRAEQALLKADTIVIVGTTFQVYPFASLLDYANPRAQILAINKDPLHVPNLTAQHIGDATDIFKLL